MTMKKKLIFSIAVTVVWYLIISVISTPPVCPSVEQCSGKLASIALNCGCGGDLFNLLMEILFFIILPFVVVFGILSTKRSRPNPNHTGPPSQN
jgi:uncharacterized membrane protein